MKSYLLLALTFGVATMVSCTKDTSDDTNISNVELSNMATSDGMTLMRTTNHDNEKWNIKMSSPKKNLKIEEHSNF